jgi:hypothetical protein
LQDLYSANGFDPDAYVESFIPGLYINDQNIDPNATPGFSQSYFVTGAVKAH